MNLEVNKIHQIDCLKGLQMLPDECVDCCVTSPPYFGLRDYGHCAQIGLERSPSLYVTKLVSVFSEVKRVLKKEGTLWLNLGDSYAGSGRGDNKKGKQGTNKGTCFNPETSGNRFGYKPKDLIGIPWMVAFALRSDCWYLRQDIIWHKPNPMPESVTDRCTKAHEYIFLLSKSAKYYFDSEAIAEDTIYKEGRPAGVIRNREFNYNSKENNNPVAYRKSVKRGDFNGKTNSIKGREAFGAIEETRNKRSVWTETTKPIKDAHFAAYPEKLIDDCIKAGSRENGIILDPFMGAGTTAVVARKLNRNYIGFELNPDYIKIAEKRIYKAMGLFKDAI